MASLSKFYSGISCLVSPHTMFIVTIITAVMEYFNWLKSIPDEVPFISLFLLITITVVDLQYRIYFHIESKRV